MVFWSIVKDVVVSVTFDSGTVNWKFQLTVGVGGCSVRGLTIGIELADVRFAAAIPDPESAPTMSLRFLSIPELTVTVKAAWSGC
jgi:hypothetical protein